MFKIEIPAWYLEAPCAEIGGDLWFPETKGQPSKQVKKICAGCPFKEPCTEIAVTEHINHGIWGGTTPRDRVAIRRERGIAELEAEEDDDEDDDDL